MPPKPPLGTMLGGIKFSNQEIATVAQKATDAVATKMGVASNLVSQDIKNAISAAAESALSARAKTLIQRDVDKAAKNTLLAGTTPVDLLNERVIAAKVGIQQVAGDSNVEDILNETAKLLKKKYDAFVKVGFTAEQAFDLLKVEVAGRAGRSR